ncbi:protein of unknown function [Cyanobium sp. NIES-981]|nr:protein of unknown function [Cyanobium sp. NIES-981]
MKSFLYSMRAFVVSKRLSCH